jgi:hypothetical protein
MANQTEKIDDVFFLTDSQRLFLTTSIGWDWEFFLEHKAKLKLSKEQRNNFFWNTNNLTFIDFLKLNLWLKLIAHNDDDICSTFPEGFKLSKEQYDKIILEINKLYEQ